MDNLSIFTQDNGVYGLLVVVTDTEENARKMMRDAYSFDKNEPIEKHEIKDGFKYFNYGDT